MKKIILIPLMLIIMSISVLAQIQPLQGQIRQNDNFVNGGGIRAYIYDNATSGNLIHNETFIDAVKSDGHFAVNLGSSVNLNVPAGEILYFDMDYYDGEIFNNLNWSGSDRKEIFFPYGNNSVITNTTELKNYYNKTLSNSTYVNSNGDSMTGNLSLSNNSINEITYLSFNINNCDTLDNMPEGTACWDKDANTWAFNRGNGQVVQTWEEMGGDGINKDTIPLDDGTIVCMKGWQGDHQIFERGNGSNVTQSAFCGVLTGGSEPGQPCNVNDLCPVTTFGDVNNIDTSNFTTADKLYLDPNILGKLTNVKPNVFNFENPTWFATVGRVSETVGSVFVSPQIDPSDGFLIDRIMVSDSIVVSNNLTVNGVSKLNTTSWTYDNTNTYLNHSGNVGIGTNSPNSKLEVAGSFNQTSGSSYVNLVYGTLQFHNDTGQIINLVTQDVFENVTVFDKNITNEIDLQNTYTFVVQKSGIYALDYGLSFTGATDTYEMSVSVNGLIPDTLDRPHRRLANTADVGNMFGRGIVHMNAGDVVNLQLRDQDNPVNNPTIISTSLTMVRVGN